MKAVRGIAETKNDGEALRILDSGTMHKDENEVSDKETVKVKVNVYHSFARIDECEKEKGPITTDQAEEQKVSIHAEKFQEDFPPILTADGFHSLIREKAIAFLLFVSEEALSWSQILSREPNGARLVWQQRMSGAFFIRKYSR